MSFGGRGRITSQPSQKAAAVELDELKELYKGKKRTFENKTQNYHMSHKFSSPKEQADTLHAHTQLKLHWLSSGTMSTHTCTHTHTRDTQYQMTQRHTSINAQQHKR